VLVFGELAQAPAAMRMMALGASGLMIAGAMLIAGSTVSTGESQSTVKAVQRECDRYGLDLNQTLRLQAGVEGEDQGASPRRWWDYAIAAAALGVFAWAATTVTVPQAALHLGYAAALSVVLLGVLAAGGWLLWKKTGFA
jgi:hypothetical protein